MSRLHFTFDRSWISPGALREDTRQWWAATLARDPLELMEDDEPATADAEGLQRFLERQVFPWFVDRRKALLNRALICEQAFGEALDTDKLEQRPLRSSFRPQAGADACHAIAAQGPAARYERRIIRLAKNRRESKDWASTAIRTWVRIPPSPPLGIDLLVENMKVGV